jgi:polyribonucleotide nucleotidyltransferase
LFGCERVELVQKNAALGASVAVLVRTIHPFEAASPVEDVAAFEFDDVYRVNGELGSADATSLGKVVRGVKNAVGKVGDEARYGTENHICRHYLVDLTQTDTRG